MIVIIAVVIASLIVFILAIVKILFWLSKYFKLENVTYKKSSLILLYLVATGSVLILLLGIIKISFLYVILEFLLFHYFLKKYYKNDWKKSLKIYISFSIAYVILSLVMVFFMRGLIFEPFIVNGGSMNPTLKQDDYLIIDKYSKSYQRGDIVVFHNAKLGSLVKRIIALPNEKMEIKNGKVFINDIELREDYIFQDVTPDKVIILSDDEYFVLGDNLSKSADSRHFGAIKSSDIVGEMIYNLANKK